MRAFILAILSASALSAAGTAMTLQLAGDWEVAARLDAPRAGLGVAELDGKLYAAGGSGLTDPRMEFESYDPEIDRWFPETPLPRGLERFGMAVSGGRIYVAGGYARGDFGVEPSASVWSWSPEIGFWQGESAMPAAKADMALFSVAGALYAIGGARDDGEIFRFDPEAREWDSREAPDGITRRGTAGVVIDERVYIIGGRLEGEASTRVDIYDPAEDSWAAGPALPDGRYGLAAALSNGRIHVFGGTGGADATTLDGHLSWAPGEPAWREETPLASPRTSAAAGAVMGRIYVVGGGSGGGFFAPFTALGDTDVFVDPQAVEAARVAAQSASDIMPEAAPDMPSDDADMVEPQG